MKEFTLNPLQEQLAGKVIQTFRKNRKTGEMEKGAVVKVREEDIQKQIRKKNRQKAREAKKTKTLKVKKK